MPPVDKTPRSAAASAAPDSALPPLLVQDRILSALFAYWRRQRAGKPFPDRADISPIDLGPRLLPHIALVEVAAADLAESRLRLVGTALVDQLGHDPTGQRLRDYTTGPYLALQVSLLEDMLRHRRPVICDSGFRWTDERFLMTRRLCLPLSHGGEAPALMLIGQTFRRPRDLDDLKSVTRLVIDV